ncbi:hypothetical protein [Xylanibacter ruminicola]|uniref:hypothetical protein n=1 Tax=Xylanibacter ruminicola TaxID=839 RepID=UPI000564BB7F|nr:hypothetical protein [Xylanibacter ruminicola]
MKVRILRMLVKIKRFYDNYIVRLLTCSFFKILGKSLSFGGLHLLLLLVLLVIGWFMYQAMFEKTNIVLHYIGVDISQVNNNYNSSWRPGSVDVVIKLNDERVKSGTNNRYKDLISVQICDTLGSPDTAYIVTVNRFPYKSKMTTLSERCEVLYDSARAFSVEVLQNAIITMPIPPDFKASSLQFCSNDLSDETDKVFYYNIKMSLNQNYGRVTPRQGSLIISLDSLDNTYNPPVSTKQFVYQTIIPTPDFLIGGYIQYYDSAKISAIYNTGLTIYAEDLDAVNNNRRKEIRDNVWMGVLIAFGLDVFVQLVIKLRNLNRKYKRKRWRRISVRKDKTFNNIERNSTAPLNIESQALSLQRDDMSSDNHNKIQGNIINDGETIDGIRSEINNGNTEDIKECCDIVKINEDVQNNKDTDES